MYYGNQLIELRNNLELTQEAVAKVLGIHKDVYGQYEREYVLIPLKHLNTLCNFFDVSLDFMFGFTKKKQYEQTKRNIDKKEAGKILKDWRKKNKITQVELAKFLNTVQPVIANYENGKHLIATPFIYMLSKNYKISSDYLLGRIKEPQDLSS